MKVTVFPWLDIANYGSVLQVFAVQKVLEKYAGEVEILNLKFNSRFSETFSRNPAKFANNILTYAFTKRNFRKVKAQINLTGKAFITEKDFNGYTADADIYCTGSDQIWNMKNGASIFGPRFLSFLPKDKRRFAFSSSFGDRMDKDLAALSAKWIHQFEYISVREDAGLRIINEQYDYHNAIQLVDPTLALPPEFWREYAPKPKITGAYILVYDIMNNKAFYEYAQALSKKTGLPLVHFCNKFARVFLKGKSVLLPPIFNFITLIDNAKYVLTGSFHATAFSMNLNTEPICAYTSMNPGRLASFLRLVDAEHRALTDFNDFDVIDRHVDFSHVNSVLAYERERVNDFLGGIFNSAPCEGGGQEPCV